MTTTHTLALAVGDPRLSPLARQIAHEIASERARTEDSRLRAVEAAMDDLRHGHDVEPTPDLTEFLEEGRGWITDIGYSCDAYALDGRQVTRILSAHYDGGVAAFVAHSAALLP